MTQALAENLDEEPIDRGKPEPIKNLPFWCKQTTIGLEIQGEVTFKQWAEGFTQLERRGKGYQWGIGDYLLEGEGRFNEEWSQVLDPEEEAKRETESGETYRKYMQVSDRLPSGNRLPNLTWTHHLKVAWLETLEEREHWLLLALREGWSSRQLERKINKAKKGEPDDEEGSDLKVLQDPEVRAWLDGYREALNIMDGSLPTQAAFLRSMVYKHREQALWQLDRTLEKDCRVVKKAVVLMLGTDDEIYTALETRGYFMSNPDLDDRLQLLVDLGQVIKKQAEGRKKTQRGKMVDVFLPARAGSHPEVNSESARQLLLDAGISEDKIESYSLKIVKTAGEDEEEDEGWQ